MISTNIKITCFVMNSNKSKREKIIAKRLQKKKLLYVMYNPLLNDAYPIILCDRTFPDTDLVNISFVSKSWNNIINKNFPKIKETYIIFTTISKPKIPIFTGYKNAFNDLFDGKRIEKYWVRFVYTNKDVIKDFANYFCPRCEKRKIITNTDNCIEKCGNCKYEY